MTDSRLRRALAAEIRTLALDGQQPIVVHGGGPFIEEALKIAKLESRFVRGLRVTTPESLDVIEQVLTRLAKVLAQEIGGAIGLSGRDSSLLVAEVLDPQLGRVGRMKRVNAPLIKNLLALGLTPVIACLAETPEGDDILNVNADGVAGAVAGALGAPAVFLSDVPGVLSDASDATSLLKTLTEREIHDLIESGGITRGMIPKVEAALEALKKGASFAVIADGRKPELLKEVLAGRAGTRVIAC